MYLRRCPVCGDFVDIRIVLRMYGFEGVIIECKNCGISLRDGRCSEKIIKDDFLSTPITQKALSECLFRAIERWNSRCKKANEEQIFSIRKDTDDWLDNRGLEV